MFEAFEPTAGFVLLESIAGALRDEFADGAMIEEQPGFQDPSEAGQVNRAFRVVARTVLQTIVPAEVDQAVLVSGLLTRLVQRRLEQGGIDERSIDVLLKTEHGRDDWLIYFLLTPWSEIELLLADEKPNGGKP
jgi:hypothetical protein